MSDDYFSKLQAIESTGRYCKAISRSASQIYESPVALKKNRAEFVKKIKIMAR